MGTMAFLAAAYLIPLPLRFVGGSEIPTAIPFRLTLFGLVAFVPGLALGTILGLVSYRAQHKVAVRSGAAFGAAMGWTSFFFVDLTGGWIIAGWAPFFEVGSGLLLAFSIFSAAAAALVLYALFAKVGHARRRLLTVVGCGTAIVAGLAVLVADFDAAGLVCVLISAGCGAVGGWVAGIGYARAGGDEMIPPGAVLRSRQQDER